MKKKDDITRATVARIAGNIAAGIAGGMTQALLDDAAYREAVADQSVKLAYKIADTVDEEEDR